MLSQTEQMALLPSREEGALCPSCRTKRIRRRSSFIWIVIGTCVAMALFVVVSMSLVAVVPSRDRKTGGQIFSGLDLPRDTLRVGLKHTKYISTNETEADQAWDAIEPGHGIVAVTHEWAEEKGLPPSREHPLRKGQLIYGIEAYHAIHCLKNIRKHYFNLKHREIFDRPEEHDLHCFDALRQYIMCTADENLLATTGHNDLGQNQVRTCKNWDALRDWASERSACYSDYEPTADEGDWPRWRKCEDRATDGLPIGSILG